MAQMPIEVVEQLAFDVGAEYFSDAQLCLRYDLTLGQLQHIKGQTAFRKELDEVRRILEDGGEKFIYAARQAAMRALNTLDEINTNPDVPTSTRVRAAEGIIEVAGVKKVQAPGEGQKIIINTNLAIGSGDKGYTVVAKATHPEVPVMHEVAQKKLAALPVAKVRHDPMDGSDLV